MRLIKGILSGNLRSTGIGSLGAGVLEKIADGLRDLLVANDNTYDTQAEELP
jgi:hypothetical protein